MTARILAAVADLAESLASPATDGADLPGRLTMLADACRWAPTLGEAATLERLALIPREVSHA